MTLKELKALSDADLATLTERRFREQMHRRLRPMCRDLGIAAGSWYLYRAGKRPVPKYIRTLLISLSLLDNAQLRAMISTPAPNPAAAADEPDPAELDISDLGL